MTPDLATASLDELETAVFDLLARGVADVKSPFNWFTLATVSPHGIPEARTVVLRGVDRPARTIELHSDTRTGKVAALRDNPKAALHFLDPKKRLQVRARATAGIHIADDTATPVFNALSDRKKADYGQSQPPQTPIRDPEETTTLDLITANTFALITCRIEHLDILHLAREGHRRARIDYSEGTRTWCVP